MKKLLFAFCFLLASLALSAQKQSNIVADSLIRVGIKLHDQGLYKEAIDAYEKALKEDKESPLINYEISYSYFEMKDYEQAIAYTDKVLSTENKHIIAAYVVKGSSLSYLNKTKEAIDVFSTAIDKYDPNYLIYFNRALVYNKTGDYKNAEADLEKALELRRNHASSHMQLGFTCLGDNKRTEGLMSLYFFLFLENSGRRAEHVCSVMKQTVDELVQKKDDGKAGLDIIINKEQLESDFKTVEMVLPLLRAAVLVDTGKSPFDDPNKSEMVNFTESFFRAIADLENIDKSNIWWRFYVPFYKDLSKAGLMETFCYYVTSGCEEDSQKWISANEDKLNQLADWFDKNRTALGFY